MMPTNPTGPPTETAAPVASEALRNAARCAPRTLRPRDSAASGPRLIRFNGRASHANVAKARDRQRQGGDERLVAADVEVAHQPAQDPERLGKVGEVLDEQDQRREERVHRHARQQQDVGRHAAMPRRAPACRRSPTAISEPAKLATGAAGMPSHDSDQPKVIASIAPSAAPAETPSVNGVASGLRSSPWKIDARARQHRADQRPGQRPRQPRDEEDLRVGVVGEGDGPVEHARQADRRGSDQRRRAGSRPRRARRRPAA